MNYGQRFVTLYKRRGSRPSPRKRKREISALPRGCLCLPRIHVLKRYGQCDGTRGQGLWKVIGHGGGAPERKSVHVKEPPESSRAPSVLSYCCCCCSTAQSVRLCGPVDCSTQGFPVLHHLPEFAHRVGDAIRPSHPLLSPSPPALNLSQDQGLFQ